MEVHRTNNSTQTDYWQENIMIIYYILWILKLSSIFISPVHMTKIELRNNKLLKNHKNNLGVKAKGGCMK